jgi:hypothetical protein
MKPGFILLRVFFSSHSVLSRLNFCYIGKISIVISHLDAYLFANRTPPTPFVLFIALIVLYYYILCIMKYNNSFIILIIYFLYLQSVSSRVIANGTIFIERCPSFPHVRDFFTVLLG